MCFVWIWEQTAIISLYSINWLVFVTATECVYCAVRSTFYVLPTQCIYVFCVDLRTNSDYFTVQHWLVGFYNWDALFTARYGLYAVAILRLQTVNQRSDWSRVLEELAVAQLLTSVQNKGLTFPSRGPGLAVSAYKLQAVTTASWPVCPPVHPSSSPAFSLSLYVSGPEGGEVIGV